MTVATACTIPYQCFFPSTPSAFQRIEEDNELGVRVKHVTRTRNDHTRSGLFAMPCLQACNCSSVVYMVLELAKISYLRNAIPTTPPDQPFQLLHREVTLMVSPALARHSLFQLLYILQPSTLTGRRRARPQHSKLVCTADKKAIATRRAASAGARLSWKRGASSSTVEVSEPCFERVRDRVLGFVR